MKKKKKGTETIDRFMKRRQKETGKVTVPETKPSPPDSAGSHKSLARQVMVGITKPKTRKKLERIAKKKKKQSQEQVFA